MAQQLSQSGQVGFKTQATKGAYLDPGAADPNQGVFPRVNSGSMVAQRDLLITDPEIGGGRHRTGAALGPVIYEGDYEMYCRFDALVTFLNGAMGATATAGPTDVTVYDHTITDGTLPWISIEEAIGQDFEVFNYTDARVNTLSITADADGYLMASVGFAAISGTSGNTRTDLAANPTFVDQGPVIVGPEISVTYNAVSLCAQSLSLEINNNLETDSFCLGQNFMDTFTPKARDITASLSIRPEDATLWKQAVYGSSGATSPQDGEAVAQQLVITVTSNTDVPGSTTAYSATFTIPKAVIAPFEVSPSGDDVIETDLEITALQPDPATEIMTAVIKNDIDVVR